MLLANTKAGHGCECRLLVPGAEPTMTDEPIFVVGSPRSGTTMLRDALRSHSRLTFPPESGVLAHLYRRHRDPTTDRAARRLAADLLGSAWIAAWKLDLTPADLEQHRSFGGVVCELYGAWARREGKARWGDKTPLYVTELPTILRIFPSAKIVHIIRDGRDVACSLRRQPWGPTNVYTAALLWRRAVETGRAAGKLLGPSVYRELRYEALVATPEPELRALCGFLGERFEPSLLCLDRILPPPGWTPPWPPHQAEAIDSSTAGIWRTVMSSDDRAVFEAVAGDVLAALGYPVGKRVRHPGRVERLLCHGRDGLGFVHWRLTDSQRVPMARQSARLRRNPPTRVWDMKSGAVVPDQILRKPRPLANGAESPST